MLAVISLAFIVLAGRAFWIQIANSDFYIAQGRARYQRRESLRVPRARIVDRNGNVLAIGEPIYDLWVDPKRFAETSIAQLQVISSTLGIPIERLKSYRLASNRFIYLKRLVDVDSAELVLAKGIPGLYGVRGEKRYFPEGALAAQVVGLAGRAGQGVEGVELAANKRLGGTVERRVVVVDRLGRVVEDPEYAGIPEPSADVVLSIDRNIQRMAFDALKQGIERSEAKAGCAIVVDAASGEILAMVNMPTFDPNDDASKKMMPTRNRALTDAFEPGSTIKPIVVALALEKGVISERTTFDTAPGTLRFHGRVVHDTSNHGCINTAEIISKSSNIGMVKISELLSAEQMWRNFRAFGLGGLPLSGFPGITAGVLRPPARWHPIEQGTMAYGYGLSVSIAQLARAYQVLANGGVIMPLSLYHSSVPHLPGPRVVTAATATSVLLMLEKTVEPGGTATMAGVPGYRVGAKTGTARKSDGNGYRSGQYLGIMAGIAPMSNPRIVVAVMIDTPTKGSFYGGPVAGPIFARILKGVLRYLGIVPDKALIAARR
ncbi:peptidoglycan D,D-transpeptidase FtsI family protein [Pandoraea apista]|nr:penicillin-binding protein 2 [Pandoraea apista]